MKRRTFLFLATIGSAEVLAGCKGRMSDGPGFIVTYASTIADKTVRVTSVDLPLGREYWNIHDLPATSDNRNWRDGRATVGVAGDKREIPPWIVFNWQVWSYPYPESSTWPGGYEAWQQEHDRLRVALPIYCSHVSVGELIPQDAVQSVIDSRASMKSGDLFPDKMFWFYFVWTDDGVKFRWELRSEAARGTTRSGGDDLD